MAKFRKVQFNMKRGCGYGQYLIEGTYRGKSITVHTTDSEAWDYIGDDSNKEKQLQARKHCYYKIVHAYEKINSIM
jgi:hypothetical protein